MPQTYCEHCVELGCMMVVLDTSWICSHTCVLIDSTSQSTVSRVNWMLISFSGNDCS